MKCLKKLCIVFGVTFCSLPMFSQTSTQFMVKDSAGSEQVFLRVEKMPQFPGGNAALLKFIGDSLVYPNEALELGLEGAVVIRFVVDKTGKAIKPEVLRSVHPLLDKAAKDVILILPNFVPGEQAGKKVPVYYMIPIQFKLAKEEKKTE